MPQRRRLGVVVVFVWGLVLVSVPAAAVFGSLVSETHTVTAGVLEPPTDLTGTRGCTALLVPRVDLEWVASSSEFADGYEIFRSTSSGGGYASIATVSGRDTTTYTDTTVSAGNTYYYVVQSTRHGWRSVNSNEASVTIPLLLC